MNSSLSMPSQEQALWRDELSQLLTEPLSPAQRSLRQGKILGVRISPVRVAHQDTAVLVISLFFPYLAPPNKEERSADEVALQVFLRGLQKADPCLRAAACEALGQLGNSAAQEALRTAASEDNGRVRVAAERALAALATPRGRKEDLAGVRLLLWRQLRHLWKPVETATTDQHGRARFLNAAPDALYRVQALNPARTPQNRFSARLFPSLKSGELAAEENNKAESLPYFQQTTLERGNLICTIYRNDQEEVIVEFRSDASQLQNGWIHFWVLTQETQQEIVNEFVALEPDRHGVLTARLVLSNIMDSRQEHEFHFEPLSKPG